ncbi:hypothetical protein CEUSTIGMA_g8859.t1 [Chlamydomonas eustigma]|uniref:Uncharacterized protein n=1 Tax=Chlamydomonas eustigma TaxID=1157962 RepID=A0A250XES5_9CHLO|nr:hypothetical protein CEUSTIGMA_g8859.t1 [Chlamydomonas eustigma]|eukprot:GAX81429.1 hypothetical protein CEUSTIGMA_g8859.t1 [Chlamydomonas eustigma]
MSDCTDSEDEELRASITAVSNPGKVLMLENKIESSLKSLENTLHTKYTSFVSEYKSRAKQQAKEVEKICASEQHQFQCLVRDAREALNKDLETLCAQYQVRAQQLEEDMLSFINQQREVREASMRERVAVMKAGLMLNTQAEHNYVIIEQGMQPNGIFHTRATTQSASVYSQGSAADSDCSTPSSVVLTPTYSPAPQSCTPFMESLDRSSTTMERDSGHAWREAHMERDSGHAWREEHMERDSRHAWREEHPPCYSDCSRQQMKDGRSRGDYSRGLILNMQAAVCSSDSSTRNCDDDSEASSGDEKEEKDLTAGVDSHPLAAALQNRSHARPQSRQNNKHLLSARVTRVLHGSPASNDEKFEVKSHLQKLRDQYSPAALHPSMSHYNLPASGATGWRVVGGQQAVKMRTPIRGSEYMNLRMSRAGALSVESLHKAEPKILTLLRNT